MVIALIIPACALLARSFLGGWLDAALWMYWAGELGLAAIIWRLSTGGWFNYALQAVVVACVLTARALARAVDGATSCRPLLPVALAVVAVPAFALTDLNQVVAKRRSETADLARFLKAVKRPSTEIFFVDRPGANRVHGRLDLVYDPWLYPVFESIGLAEPRSVWLEEVLATGPVRIVATTSSRPVIDGLTHTLPDLGYRQYGKAGPYFVWSRQADAAREVQAFRSHQPADCASATLSVEFATCYNRLISTSDFAKVFCSGRAGRQPTGAQQPDLGVEGGTP